MKTFTDADYIAAYIKLRDIKEYEVAEHKKKKAEINEQLEAIESKMLVLLKERGAEKTSSDFGTAYMQTNTEARVVDRATFFHYVAGTKRFDLLTSHVNKAVVHQIVEQTHSPPPGVKIDQRIRVIFRRI